MTTRLPSWLATAWPSGRDGLEGQGMVEYALILVLVAVAAVAGVALVGDGVLELAAQIDDVIIGALNGG